MDVSMNKGMLINSKFLSGFFVRDLVKLSIVKIYLDQKIIPHY